MAFSESATDVLDERPRLLHLLPGVCLGLRPCRARPQFAMGFDGLVQRRCGGIHRDRCVYFGAVDDAALPGPDGRLRVAHRRGNDCRCPNHGTGWSSSWGVDLAALARLRATVAMLRPERLSSLRPNGFPTISARRPM